MEHNLVMALAVLKQLLVVKNLLLMACGVLIGIFEGGFSGSGGSLLLAILLPFIIHMPPLTALTFLLAAHAGVAFGGSITAIVLNVPGNAEVVAVCWDGYPLARQGRASEALAAAAVSTGSGGIIGAAFLFTMIPLLQRLTMAFAAPEYFALTIAGIILIALMTGENLPRGVIAGLAGIMLSMIGRDPFTGQDRYTFGLLFLQDGIPFIPVVIGLYGISQIINLFGELLRPKRRGVAIDYKAKGLFTGMIQVFRNKTTLFTSSLLGVFTGMIPGMGGAVSNILSYGLAQTISREKNNFGQGAIAGVIAPMASDNAKEGGALIPALTFGIPSTSTMTVFLAAWLMVGVTPGPGMLTTHLDLTLGMIWALLFGNLGVVVFALLINTQLARVAELRADIMIVLIATVGLVGAYSATYSITGVLLAIVFGFLGVGMERYNYPRQTLLMGLILGGLAERNFNMSYESYGWRFMERPIVLAIAIVCLLGVIVYYIQRRKKKVIVAGAEGMPRHDRD